MGVVDGAEHPRGATGAGEQLQDGRHQREAGFAGAEGAVEQPAQDRRVLRWQAIRQVGHGREQPVQRAVGESGLGGYAGGGQQQRVVGRFGGVPQQQALAGADLTAQQHGPALAAASGSDHVAEGGPFGRAAT